MTIAIYRDIFLKLQILFLAVSALSMYLFDMAGSENFVLLYSVWNIVTYTLLFYGEMRYAPDFHPFQILALVAIMFIGVNGLSLYQDIRDGEELRFGIYAVNDCIAQGMLFLSIEHILLFGSFYYLEQRYEKSSSKVAERIKKTDISYLSWATYSYILVWILRVVNQLYPLDTISSILVNITTIGPMLTLLLILFERMRNSNKKGIMLLHWMIVLLEIILVLNHGMKEEIIRLFVPYFLYVLIEYKSGGVKIRLSSIITIGILSIFIVGFVFPYISLFRDISNDTNREWSQVSVSETMNAYEDYIAQEGKYWNDKEDRSIGYVIDRAGSIVCNAWSVNDAQKDGTKPEYFMYCLMAPIPRIIWTEKPVILTGAMAHQLITGSVDWMNQDTAKDEKTSVSLGFIGSCVLSFGVYGGILLVSLMSVWIWYVWHVSRKKMHNNVIAMWMFLAYISLILKDFEGLQDCGINMFFINAVYIAIMNIMSYKNKYKLSRVER